MATGMIPGKHDRDTTMEFQGFLNNLQEWESSFKDANDKKLRQKPPSSSQMFGGMVSGDSSRDSSGVYRYPKHSIAANHSSVTGYSALDASSEKELGNDFFKQKKFNEAIDCYSRSIALSPTAVAFANRAMAYLKLKRFREAEEDCTEALNLDDRYIKAYSRRATARKELEKFKEAVEDSEIALKLEPNNIEIKKQYTEYKSLYQKGVLQKASSALRSNGNANKTVNPNPKVVKVMSERSSSQRIETMKPSNSGKQQLNPSVEELASKAASLAMTVTAKNMKPSTSAYQFEITWKSLSGNIDLQSQLLKVTNPSTLPQIFKNALSVPILLDIIKCVAKFFMEDPALGIKYLQNLTRVPRFDMLLMCVSSADRKELLHLWDNVFCKEVISMEDSEILDNLRSKYFPQFSS